jgi:5'-nucleotidase
MTTPDWPLLIGFAAAGLTTLAFLPQLFKIKRAGSAELSSTMLGMYLTGQVLWLIYGLKVRSLPVILANGVSIVLVSAVTFRKAAARAAGQRPRRLRIAVDMDEVMADALTEQVRRYNAAFAASVTIHDLRGRHLEECIPPAHRETAEAMFDASFFVDLAVMPDCQAVLRDLALRHDVFVVSAAMDVPASFDAKFRWLQRHFPFIPPDQIVFCGDKGIVDADYLIDDRPRHFARFKGRPLLFSAPHNAGERRYPRVDSWRDVREVFARLERTGPVIWEVTGEPA